LKLFFTYFLDYVLLKKTVPLNILSRSPIKVNQTWLHRHIGQITTMQVRLNTTSSSKTIMHWNYEIFHLYVVQPQLFYLMWDDPCPWSNTRNLSCSLIKSNQNLIPLLDHEGRFHWVGPSHWANSNHTDIFTKYLNYIR